MRRIIRFLGRFIGSAVLWLPGSLIRRRGSPLALSGRSRGILARMIVRVCASGSIFPCAIDSISAQPWTRGPGRLLFSISARGRMVRRWMHTISALVTKISGHGFLSKNGGCGLRGEWLGRASSRSPVVPPDSCGMILRPCCVRRRCSSASLALSPKTLGDRALFPVSSNPSPYVLFPFRGRGLSGYIQYSISFSS